MRLIKSLGPVIFCFSLPAFAQVTSGVYVLKQQLQGRCFENIKVFYTAELNQLDILGPQPGQIVLQMSNVNLGQKYYIAKNEKNELVTMATATSTMSEKTFEHKTATQNKTGYYIYDLKVQANYNQHSIAFAGVENKDVSRSISTPQRSFSCIYIKK